MKKAINSPCDVITVFHSAVWTWLASAKPGTYKVDTIVPYINSQLGNAGLAVTIQDRSLFIEGVMFWMDYGLHPQCDFNSEYTKMRIYSNPNRNPLTMKKLLYAFCLCLLLTACGSLYTVPTDPNRYVLVTKKAVFVTNGDSTVKYLREKTLTFLKY